MFGWRRRSSPPVVSTATLGREGLVVGLHGYGSNENQLETLMPIAAPVTMDWPRAPHEVEPGFGWWLPQVSADGSSIELAAEDEVASAVELVASHILSSQERYGIGPDRTYLVGYSQGAALALQVAAHRPELLAGVASVAGALAHRTVISRKPPLSVLIMNGTHDPVVTAEDHHASVQAFVDAGHAVRHHIDPVPHVVDKTQAARVNAWLQSALAQAAA